uniref:Uncharacterized protein n=1 Tax=Solanum lycopersicum TaxID=4081 RepID=A0A3Q7IT84_SOLLC
MRIRKCRFSREWQAGCDQNVWLSSSSSLVCSHSLGQPNFWQKQLPDSYFTFRWIWHQDRMVLSVFPLPLLKCGGFRTVSCNPSGIGFKL